MYRFQVGEHDFTKYNMFLDQHSNQPIRFEGFIGTVMFRLTTRVKGKVHCEINFWYVYLKAIQDVGVFVSTVFSIFIFLGKTVCYHSHKAPSSSDWLQEVKTI